MSGYIEFSTTYLVDFEERFDGIDIGLPFFTADGLFIKLSNATAVNLEFHEIKSFRGGDSVWAACTKKITKAFDIHNKFGAL